eukprot:EC719396.1.p1 GENE.EC719396.1~~EC719396.1.p1  ORF type:complete len:101 (+),score=10.59 EC719396.1:38-340(+)
MSLLKTLSTAASGLLMAGETWKVVCKRLAQGASVPTHRHPGYTVMLSVLEGDISATITPTGGDGQTYALTQGQLATFSGEHQVSLLAGNSGACFTVTLLK